MTPLSLFLIACTTVFLGSVQAAFSALMRLSLRLMAERGGRDDRLGRYLDDPLQLFIPVRILIGVCTVLAGGLIARLSTVDNAVAVATFCVSLIAFVMVCEHLLPMLLTRRNPEKVIDFLLPAFHPIARAMRPLTGWLAERSGARGDREVQGPGTDADAASKASGGFDDQGDDGAISEAEGRELLHSIVDFTEAVVREVMTPRPDIVAIRADASLGDLRTLFREEQYSRIPVYRGDLDDIIGIVFVKDLAALPPSAEPPLTTLMRSAYMVPESKRVAELLKEMQRRQAQTAIVVDEHGGTAGLVTVEDLLEEIVGEIVDEDDEEEVDPVKRLSPTINEVDGRVHIDDLVEEFNYDLPQGRDFDTIGGFVFSQLGRIPEVSETLEYGRLRFTILEADPRRILKLRIECDDSLNPVGRDE